MFGPKCWNVTPLRGKRSGAAATAVIPTREACLSCFFNFICGAGEIWISLPYLYLIVTILIIKMKWDTDPSRLTIKEGGRNYIGGAYILVISSKMEQT
jgi:hypothetical protein